MDLKTGGKQAVRVRADIAHACRNLSEGRREGYNTIFYPSH